jgi:hypothetical protein
VEWLGPWSHLISLWIDPFEKIYASDILKYTKESKETNRDFLLGFYTKAVRKAWNVNRRCIQNVVKGVSSVDKKGSVWGASWKASYV